MGSGVIAAPGKKISLEDQLATGRAHADRHGAQVVAELVVPGESRNTISNSDSTEYLPVITPHG